MGLSTSSVSIQNCPASDLFRAAGHGPSTSAWADALWVTALDGDGRPASARAPAVALFDGRLLPSYAELFRQAPPVSLLARAENGLPSRWSLVVLDALWGGGLEAIGKVDAIVVHQRSDLRKSCERVAELAAQAGAGKTVAELAADVAYELAANALLDAPVDAAGSPKYAHRRDEPNLRIADEDATSLDVGVDGGRLFLIARDRYGRLRPTSFARTIESLMGRAKVDQSGGGAGLGLRRIIEGSSMLAARVTPGLHSEVLAVVDLGENRRRANGPKSVLFRIE